MTNEICGYRWAAPLYLYGDPPGKPSRSEPQVCSLPPGHEGWHRSDNNVVTPPRGS